MAKSGFEQQFFEKVAPKRFANVTLESCDKQPKDFVEYARSWAKRPESVVLMGPVGRGKTHFAFSMIREALRYNEWLDVKYQTSPELDALLLSLKHSDDNFFKVDSAKTADLFFLDDLGRETCSKRASDQYFEFINYRYANLLPTIISTNLTIDQISVNMNDAIASRFQEFQIIEFGGEDLRTYRKIG